MSTLRNSIKNIIFDFGGVIYDIDFHRSAMAFRDLGIVDFNDMYTKVLANELIDKYEKGQLSNEEFRNEMRRLSGKELTDAEVDEAWNAILVGFVRDRVELIEKIKDHYNIFILSNTSDIHYNRFIKEFERGFGYTKFEDLFEKAWLSYRIGMRKPDTAIYEFVVEDGKLNKEETLFIDDSLPNIIGAKESGIATHYLDVSKGEDMMDLFDDEGFLVY